MTVQETVPSDLEIAQAARILPITDVACSLGLREDEVELYGRYKAKVTLSTLGRLRRRPDGKYVVVTAITPTPLGEGKTTTTVGLGQGLGYIGKKSAVCIRQPSLGPVFGIKGGAAGGGYAQVVPMEDFNLHLTGDNYAVGAAHNLCSAFLDNHLHHGNKLNIDPSAVVWPRVTDISDRALRKVMIGLGDDEKSAPREGRFDITAASEVMAVLALASDVQDLRDRLGRIVVAYTREGAPVTAEDLKVAGAMAVLLKDAVKPNLLQTLGNTAAFVHAGPFGNIAHGNSSILADRIALKLADYVITESGFGADLGMEKFMDIKCRYSGLAPDVVVLVATIRGLKSHSGRFRIRAGKPLDPALVREDLTSLQLGISNLEKQVENARLFGVPVVVAINRFGTDTAAEIELVKQCSLQSGAEGAYVADHYLRGGQGAAELAEAVVRAGEKPKRFQYLYPDGASIKEKIEMICTRMYGAAGVSYQPEAERAIEKLTEAGYSRLPICMAKTHLSLSHDPALKGRPAGFTVPVREVRLSAGAGFIYPLAGDVRTMPGLPSAPAGESVDIDADGRVRGLF
ncbi:MAG: formate--tetrahydrofolate ligase [Chloroflexota bacterium]|nr:formate--tetrahydrofolate ligase [Chloroflexota bacterium]